MKLVKCKEHDEIFKIENSKKYWVENWSTFVFIDEQMELTWNELLAEVEIVPFEELRDKYLVGSTMVKKTVTAIVDGKKPDDIFYPEMPPVTIRKMCILGTCLPGCEQLWKELGGTHFYGNRYGWPSYEEVERLGMKVFVNLRGEHGYPTDEEIREKVLKWKVRPGCGGYWCDQLGHEPDITNPPLDKRGEFYVKVRELDPDEENHPVMEMFDLTEDTDFPNGEYPGWKNAYNEGVLDLLLFDCYVFDQSDRKMKNEIHKFYEKFPEKYCENIQVIPQLNSFQYRRGSIKTAYEAWKECLGNDVGVAYYKDETVRNNAEMQQEIAEVNQQVMK